MVDEEKLKREVRELLSGEKSPTSIDKKIIYDKNAKQFIIKIPREVAIAANLQVNNMVRIVYNPNEEEFNKALESHFIIYAKEKKEKPAT